MTLKMQKMFSKGGVNVKQRIAKLIDLKSIITIIITGVLTYGFIVGKISNEQFMTIATMIFTFYFAKKDKNKEGDEWRMATTDTRTEEEIQQEQEECKGKEEE